MYINVLVYFVLYLCIRRSSVRYMSYSGDGQHIAVAPDAQPFIFVVSVDVYRMCISYNIYAYMMYTCICSPTCTTIYYPTTLSYYYTDSLCMYHALLLTVYTLLLYSLIMPY